MALVHVVHARRHLHGPQRFYAADAQQQVLLNPQFLIAAVQPRRQLAVLFRVVGHVAVEQQYPNTPDLEGPDAQRDLAAHDPHAHAGLFAAV